jgi:hypothetical protein
MKIVSFVVGLVVSMACWADQITLKNGDRLTGAIVKKDGKSLVVNSDSLGPVTVPWEQVVAVQSETPLNVVLPDGKTVQSAVVTSSGRVDLKATGQSIPLEDVVAIRNAAEQASYERLLNPPWSRLWTGTATLGFAGTQGNARTRTFTVAMTSARETRTDKTKLYFNAVKASALVDGISAGTAQAIRGGWAYGRTFTSRMFVNVFNDYEYDRFQSLDLRFVGGGGLGFSAWKGQRGRLDFVGGGAYNHEKFAPLAPDPEFTRDSAEAYWGEDASYKVNETTSLNQSFRMFNNLSETGEYRMNFDLGANTRLLKWLTWNLGFSNRFLSNPVPGRLRNDILYTTGVGVTFAR